MMTSITEWIAAHEPDAEPPTFCEHCGTVLEAHYVEQNGIRRWRNEVHTYNCPEGHYPHQEHIYCLECKKEIFGEIHDRLAEFRVYDPETGQKVKK